MTDRAGADRPKAGVGDRVVVRYRHGIAGKPPFTDVIGHIESLEPLVVRDRRGVTTQIDRDAVVAVKLVGEPPTRRAPGGTV